MGECFSESQLLAIAHALGDTDHGLTGSEIGDLLQLCRVSDEFAGATKWKRVYYTLWNRQCSDNDRRAVLAFIRKAMKPERYLRDSERFAVLRANLNRALSFAGLEVAEDGALRRVERATTIEEAEQRAADLRAALLARKVHPDVLAFCRAELLEDNFFHAVLEAMKSVFEKIRTLSGLSLDGASLVDRAFGLPSPILAVNDLATDSQRSEHTGFINLIKGASGMFRNPTAHEARVKWEIGKEDAEDLLSLVSFIHRRLDGVRRVS
jgi:uncharacterized protein (TIGR02391 family)